MGISNLAQRVGLPSHRFGELRVPLRSRPIDWFFLGFEGAELVV
jgi:hypothetical protein